MPQISMFMVDSKIKLSAFSPHLKLKLKFPGGIWSYFLDCKHISLERQVSDWARCCTKGRQGWDWELQCHHYTNTPHSVLIRSCLHSPMSSMVLLLGVIWNFNLWILRLYCHLQNHFHFASKLAEIFRVCSLKQIPETLEQKGTPQVLIHQFLIHFLWHAMGFSF